ncbi:growth arrest-specific protein 2-like [Asterias amurensis]|uniref:growth arrest-specific protein 2-like n=1 Tax=Asterias amurensis TaxID=7602 RepID=UPI003AB1C113
MDDLDCSSEGDEYFQEIARGAEESLVPLKEDLSEWLTRVLGEKITATGLVGSIANGVLLCKLAQLIQDKAVECQRAGKSIGKMPVKKLKYRQNAAAESFFARDNVATFLSWCRDIGLEDTCLFETDGLVLQKTPQNVLVCVYELARLAGRYGIDPPGLVKLEKEIEKEQQNPRPASAVKKKSVSLLDTEVMNVAKQCDFELDIRRVSEGKYNIGGKMVFIRMLRGRHVMVRVGGGWDTLERFLKRHEASKITRISRGSITTEAGESVPDDFFHVQAKYKGDARI